MTNLISALLVALSFLLEGELATILYNTGVFALSGAITNWLAIHMLFEKVPGLYGSGVIPAHFEDFKRGIHDLFRMLSMFGGETALQPLREPFCEKMKVSLDDISRTEAFQKTLQANISQSSASDEVHRKVEVIVKGRLDELTPQLVKEIIQRMIREHLGWLVVWGGVFGGLIGVVASQFPQ
jgi:uncharacterized membrane protein YheB (UPF0754 family)